MSVPLALPAVASSNAQPPGLAIAAAAPGADVSAAAGEIREFAALFRQAAARQMAGEADAEMHPPPWLKPAAEDALAALLPFLEGMGLLAATGVTQSADPAEGDAAAISAVLAQAVGKGQDRGALSLSAPAGALGDDSGSAPAEAMAASLAAKSVASGKVDANALSSQGKPFAASLQTASDRSPASANAESAWAATAIAPHAPAAARGGGPTLPVAHPVNDPGWGQEVGNRIVWMAHHRESQAELVLTPPQMGRVAVTLSVAGDQAAASFVSANPAVREALEAALPRLREILAEAGIQLGQAQVGAEQPGQSARQEHDGTGRGMRTGAPVTGGTSSGEIDAGAMPAGLKSGRGLVDVFA